MTTHFFDEHFGDLWDCVRGHAIGLAQNRFGNWGDELIQRGTLALFAHYGVRCRVLRNDELAKGKWPEGITLIAEPGGGNIGTRPGLGSPRRRRVLAQMPGPRIVLPQSASDDGENLSAFKTVFAREETTWRMLRKVHPDVRLVPDMALALDLPSTDPVHDDGLFLRDDAERTVAGGVDPLRLVRNADQYVALAGSYRRVITNRLHFAIAALLQDRSVVLKANSYHKNRSMFDTWLRRFPKATWGD